MTVSNSALKPPTTHVQRRSATLRYVLGSAIAIFCLANVYRSTTTSNNFGSSHDYLRRAEAIHKYDDSTFGWNGSFSRKKNSKEIAIFDRLARVTVPNPVAHPPYNKSVRGQLVPVPLWQRRLWAGLGNRTSAAAAANNAEDDDASVEDENYYYLAELLQVRIYSEDKAKWSINELKQWMHYLFLAGVQHVYLCDHYMYDHERLDGALAKYIRLGLLTYMPWGQTRDPMTAQVRCYQRFINRYRRRHLWQIAVDMDEYPFALNDTDEDFLIRFLRSFPEHVTEISMPNFLMLGRGDRSGQLVIERINRITKQSNVLVKPIYRPQRVQANIHHNHLLSGSHVDARPEELQMLHYWGARSQQWGPDTQKTLSITTEWHLMRIAWADRIRNSLIAFDEFDAITNSTGP